MKKTLLTSLLGIAFAGTTLAGPVASAKEVIVPPPAPCLWSWFAGGSAETVQNDWDEEIYSFHIGVERQCPGSNCSQAIYLEVGYSDKDAGFHREEGAADVAGYLGLNLGQQIRVGLEAEIMPITVNYKYECSLAGNLNWYIGAGAGIALVDLEFYTTIDKVTFDDAVFYAHAFAGLSYNISASIEVFAGARYVWMDDPSLTGIGMFDDAITLDGEIIYELGARFNF
ncbi:MAG: P44/Msp2 family outer membrane protein [Akkermansiaceae bacterium]|nr:P44/Msp2 family outer membrane protein [Akkermansiaceae bacterium]